MTTPVAEATVIDLLAILADRHPKPRPQLVVIQGGAS